MNLKEIREKKPEDLMARLRELGESVFRARCVVERLTPQKGAEVNSMKKEIARIHTILSQRELSVGVKKELADIGEKLASGKGRPRLRRRQRQLGRVQHELDLLKGK